MPEVCISIITSLYKSEVFLKDFLSYVLKISNLSECELIIIHNDPTDFELETINAFKKNFFSINHVIVKREGLYNSWNRAIKVARGKYLAVWNVDDIRTPNSLVLQKSALDQSNAVMCYGDFYASMKYGEHKDVFYEYGDDFTKFRKQALRRHIVGGFPMWKKELHDKIGYFDEQFKLVADWEFQIRTALNFDLVKSKGFLGYFLTDVPNKLSSNRRLQGAEQTVVRLRYHIYNAILLHYLIFVKGFTITKVLSFGTWYELKNFIPKSSYPLGKKLFNIAGLPFYYSGWLFIKVVSKIYKSLFKSKPASIVN